MAVGAPKSRSSRCPAPAAANSVCMVRKYLIEFSSFDRLCLTKKSSRVVVVFYSFCVPPQLGKISVYGKSEKDEKNESCGRRRLRFFRNLLFVELASLSFLRARPEKLIEGATEEKEGKRETFEENKFKKIYRITYESRGFHLV